MDTYQTPADSDSSPTMFCSSSACATSCQRSGSPDTEAWSNQGRTAAETTTATTRATA